MHLHSESVSQMNAIYDIVFLLLKIVRISAKHSTRHSSGSAVNVALLYREYQCAKGKYAMYITNYIEAREKESEWYEQKTKTKWKTK